MRKKNITLFFEYFEHEHFGKDPFLVPYTLGQMSECDVIIVYPQTESNKDIPNIVKGVNMVPLQVSQDGTWSRSMYLYIWKHAPEIDIFMRFFDNDLSRNAAIIYKLRNPRGKFYIKMDVNPNSLPSVKKERIFFKEILVKIKDYVGKSCVDLVSCETQLALQKLNQNPNYRYHWGNKIVLMPNGFDEELLSSFNIIERTFHEKEKIMITVSRLGTPPKNTSMLLNALSIMDLKDWTFYFVGPIDPEFIPEIERFYQNNPSKKCKVIFTGAIYDKKELWEYYNRSRVFVLTSRWESYALVLAEAQRFRNYIVTTKVGAAQDVILDCRYGEYIEQDANEQLAEKLTAIINGKTNIDVYSDFDIKSLSWESRLKIVADKLNS